MIAAFFRAILKSASMQTYAFILGRIPELSIEELLVVLTPLGHIVEVTPHFLIFEGMLDPTALLPRLGGTIKIAEVAATMEDFRGLTKEKWLHILRSELSGASGRFEFGASVYGSQQAVRHMQGVGLSLKKHLKTLPLSARFLWNRDAVLSSVVVQKNHLLKRELLLLGGKRWYCAVTSVVQDFDSYGARDYGRPSRNMVRGMLPPKLAQIMLNIGEVKRTDRLLDPFCGGGTIIQEALLMGLTDVWGTDKDPKAIDEATRNVEWLVERFGTKRPTIAAHDVQNISQAFPARFFDLVVTEPFLGPARLLKRGSLTRRDLDAVAAETTVLYQQLFRSLAPVVRTGGRLVIVSPIYRVLGQERTPGPFDSLERIGWKRRDPQVLRYLASPVLSSRGQLMYDRKDQVVAREVSVWFRV